ncbi:MAG: GNAT family N-acetyltransferase [Pseudomonadota bacterium]
MTNTNQIPTITTDRLRLRAFEANDLEAFSSICSNPKVMQYIGDGKVLTKKDAWADVAYFLGHWGLRGYGVWGVELISTGELIGRIGFINPEGWPGFELSWLLGEDYWGNGYATEGAASALSYAFNELKQTHVISLIYPQNQASIRVAERLKQSLESETEIYAKRVLVYGIESPSER